MFLPVTMDSAERIVETIQEIKEKIPSDPFEAELILMAEMVAEQDERNDKSERTKERVTEKETEKQEAAAADGERRTPLIDRPLDRLRMFLNETCASLQITSVTIATTWTRTTWPVSSTTGRRLRLTPQASGRPVSRPLMRSSTPSWTFPWLRPASLSPSPRPLPRLPWTLRLTSLSVRSEVEMCDFLF